MADVAGVFIQLVAAKLHVRACGDVTAACRRNFYSLRALEAPQRGLSMSNAEEFFERSRAYTAAADVEPEAAARVRLLQLAQHWAHLGQVAERNELRSKELS